METTLRTLGFFTDAYDLFVIGIVVCLLKSQRNLSTGQVSLLTSITPGRLRGRCPDLRARGRHPRRKRIYGYEVLILAIGAIASAFSAFSADYAFLLISRAVLGIGDYPVSATIMSEYAGRTPAGGWWAPCSRTRRPASSSPR